MADLSSGFDPDMLKKLAAQRASDAAGYQSSVAQAESWATPKPAAQPAPAAPTANAAVASRVGGVIDTMRNTANSKLVKGGGAVAALGAISDAANADSTDRYATRFGVAPPTGDGSLGDIAKFAGLRAGGFATDLANNMTFGLAGKLLYRDGAQPAAQPSVMQQAQPKPGAATATPATVATQGAAPVPALGGATSSQTSVPGITRLDGGDFKSPMFTDNPARAVAEYSAKGGPIQALAQGGSALDAGDRLSVIPSTANADRAFLAGAFQRHVNSGDLERARATAVSPEDMAQLGAAEAAQQRAQAQAYAAAPMETMLKTLLGKSDREKRLEGDITDRAFSGTRRGNVVPKTGDAEQINGLIQMLAANAAKGGNTDPAKAAADALAAMSNSKAAATAQSGAAITQAGQVQMQALQQQLLKETDPTKREQIIENLQTLTGKYEKKGSEAKTKLYPIDVDTGKTDVMGQPIYKKALADETGRIIGGPQAATAAAPTRAQLEADAQSAIGKGANKDAVKQALAAKLKELGL